VNSLSKATQPSSAPRRRLSVIGVLGELLVTVGLIAMLFLGWQLWWNNLVIGAQQATAAAEFSRDLAAHAPTHASGSTGVPIMSKPELYRSIAVVYAPRLGATWKRVVREGIDSERVLDSYTAGVGHYPGSQLPGQLGNFAVAGHDTGWGNTFIGLGSLRVGDKIYVQTAQGWYTYSFRNLEYVQPSAFQVVDAVPQHEAARPLDRLMTITTCNPPFHAGERLVAYSVFDGFSRSAPRVAGHTVGG
jgi:sortase A